MKEKEKKGRGVVGGCKRWHTGYVMFPLHMISYQETKRLSILCLYIFILQPQGPGRYEFDIGCELHGQYHSSEQVNSANTNRNNALVTRGMASNFELNDCICLFA